MSDGRPDRLGDHPGFRRFWAASTVSDFGTSVTTVALQVLVVVTLQGSATDVGVVSAARWLPYLALGVLADAAGYRTALWVGVAGVATTAVVLRGSPLRPATLHEDTARSSTH